MQYLKSRPDESQVADSLRFLLAAMGALKKRNPLTESFLVQLDVDLEALGTRIPKLRNVFQRSTDGVFVSLHPMRQITSLLTNQSAPSLGALTEWIIHHVKEVMAWAFCQIQASALISFSPRDTIATVAERALILSR